MSDMENTIEFDAKGLTSLIAALKTPISARVGILGGNKNARTQAVLHSSLKAKGAVTTKGPAATSTNAEVGAAHEFGTDKLPIRSFLRIPISEKLQEYLELSRAFDEDAVKAVIKEGTIKSWVKKVAVVAEAIVSDAFDSRGFGRWAPSDMRYKQNQQTLVETQQLRNSITSDVK